MIHKIQKHRVLPALSEPPLPPIRKMVATAVKEAVKIVHHGMTTGRVFAKPEQREARKAICRTCKPHFRESDQRCAHPNCGCKLTAKAAFDCLKCPDTPPKW